MAISPISDGYPDPGMEGRYANCHTPVVLGRGKFAMLTNVTEGGGGSSSLRSLRMGDAAPAALPPGNWGRLYTMTATGYTRGDPVELGIDIGTARACAATADGNILTQGIVQASSSVYHEGDLIDGPALWVQPPYVFLEQTRSLWELTGNRRYQKIRVTQKTFLNTVNVWLYAAGPIDTYPFPVASVGIASAPDGTGNLANSGPVGVGRYQYMATFDLNYELQANTDYYLYVANQYGFELSRLMGTAATVMNGPGAATFTPETWVDGVRRDDVGSFRFWTGITGAGYWTSYDEPAVGYAVLNGATLATGPAAAVQMGRLDTVLSSGIDAMARIPGTNRYWAVRSHATGTGYIDLLQVTGMKVKVLASATLDTNYPRTPHALMAISTTTAILCNGNISSIPYHRMTAVNTAGKWSIAHGNITLGDSRLPANDMTLVEGLNHQAEVLVQNADGNPLHIDRMGVDYINDAWTIAQLPLKNLPEKITPPGYTPRSRTWSISMIANSAAVAFDGNLVVARTFTTNGTDDNWIHLTQYSQETGGITATTWVKGDYNGGKTDQLHTLGIGLRWDPTEKRLILGCTEYYLPITAYDYQQVARLGIYKVSYSMTDALRKRRERFER